MNRHLGVIDTDFRTIACDKEVAGVRPQTYPAQADSDAAAVDGFHDCRIPRRLMGSHHLS